MSVRRSLVIGTVGLAAVLAAQTTALATPSATSAGTQAAAAARPPGVIVEGSLRALGSFTGLRIGTAVNTDLLGADPAYTEIVNREFNTVTPENVMKWEVVEPTRGSYDFSGADELVKSAQQNGQLVRGHTLVWHSQLPSWLASNGGMTTTFTDQQVKDIVKKHIQDEAGRYKGRIWAWDVVNEAFNDDGTPRQSIFYKAWGNSTDYIADAFRWADQADPSAQLFYNDYNIEYTGPKSQAVYDLVKKLKAQGVPIDGVGFQTHLSTQYGFPDLQQTMQRFADLGLNVAETEVDVRTAVKPGATAGTFTSEPLSNLHASTQQAYWDQSLKACLFVQRCVSYTVWGVADSNSWIPGVFPGEGAALLFNDSYQAKREYTVVQQDLALAAGMARHRTGEGSGGR
ncbi:endo-1,4-beta-xylanase [Modestobacter sp. L9-4]|uniref:endo-1,4-beta-xylanase n=1 Tax=Modestobacter sp. L9-4 TaxID=2851567 RepID=UPI001C774F1F|nr:endo-1,4-beta-xylanase [Modestobacter sp. L9-4]QXG77494.1 endo-1,4-beta-xylanase [Modestobacter sp. L9-4]